MIWSSKLLRTPSTVTESPLQVIWNVGLLFLRMALNSEPPARLSLRCAERTTSSLLCFIYTFSESAVSLDPETEAQFMYDKEEKQANRSLEMETHMR